MSEGGGTANGLVATDGPDSNADGSDTDGAAQPGQSSPVRSTTAQQRKSPGELPRAFVERLLGDLRASIKRKTSQEAWVSGALREFVGDSSELVAEGEAALEVLVERSSYDRPLYAGLARGLAAHGAGTTALARALQSEGGGGLVTISAAALSSDPELEMPLARAMVTRQPHTMLAAELARAARGESDGAATERLAPLIKEAHRIALCADVLVPLLQLPSLPEATCRGFELLREAERHLGRWLVMAEHARRAGDDEPRIEALAAAAEGPSSARAAWSLVHWALDPEVQCDVRPTVELVSRLSDRPSSEKDMSFLFRLADARVPLALPALEQLSKGRASATELGVRAVGVLAAQYGQDRALEQLKRVAEAPKKEVLRGLAASWLSAAGQAELAQRLASELVSSKKLPTASFCALIVKCAARHEAPALVSETQFRRLQLGRSE